MKGLPTYVEAYGTEVRVYVSSPESDASDMQHCFTINCTDPEQSRAVAKEWARLFSVDCYDAKEDKVLLRA